jgi:hypothetical protein
MRDFQTYNPEKYQQLQEYQEKERVLDQINMMSTGNYTGGENNLQTQTGESINNYLTDIVART